MYIDFDFVQYARSMKVLHDGAVQRDQQIRFHLERSMERLQKIMTKQLDVSESQ